MALKKQRDSFEQLQDKKLKKDIERLRKMAEEKKIWSQNAEKEKLENPHQKKSKSYSDKGFIGARLAALMKKSKNLEKRMRVDISKKEKLLHNIEKSEVLTMEFKKVIINLISNLKIFL
ncbi:MAG: hypothetical protein ACK5LM_00715 [Lactovum sp.]